MTKKDNAIVPLERVRTKDPLTGKTIFVDIEKPVKRDPEQVEKDIKKSLKKHKVKAVEKIEVRDPLTNEKSLITIDRTGTGEQDLALALLDKDMPRDKKDHMLSMYLFERGHDNVSMLVDLIRYKGNHSKQSQVFQSQMRFDFEAFANSFVIYLQNQSRLLGITLGVNIKQEKEDFIKWAERNKGTYVDFYKSRKRVYLDARAALVEMAIYADDEAEALLKAIERIKVGRMASKGFGIYVDKNGRPFSVNDPELDEVIKAEREIEKQANKDNDQ